MALNLVVSLAASMAEMKVALTAVLRVASLAVSSVGKTVVKLAALSVASTAG